LARRVQSMYWHVSPYGSRVGFTSEGGNVPGDESTSPSGVKT
jgi:hypothetical protein